MGKNVCHIVQNYYPKDVRVRKEVMALLSQGHKVSVIALRGQYEPEQEVIDGVKVYRISVQKKRSGVVRYLFEYATFFLLSFYKLNVLDLKENFDVVHINTLPDFLVFSAALQKIKGRKIILDMHEIMPEFFISKYGVSFKNPFVRLLLFLEKISLRFADNVITINEPIKQIFNKRAIPNKPIVVVMNTAEEVVGKSAEKRLHENFNCVYHGTLTEIYGLDTAIKGFSKACTNAANMIFHIYGTGPHLSKLKYLTEQLNLQQFVIFHGEIPHDKMMESLAEMDIGILATRKDVFLSLSFSNKLAEYINLKIPVISSYFEAGNINDLGDKILFAYKNKERMHMMAESAYKRAKPINWAIMTERYLKVVEGN
jgi:glycosyltransferase involved in cell wall biosynthesis